MVAWPEPTPRTVPEASTAATPVLSEVQAGVIALVVPSDIVADAVKTTLPPIFSMSVVAAIDTEAVVTVGVGVVGELLPLPHAASADKRNDAKSVSPHALTPWADPKALPPA